VERRPVERVRGTQDLWPADAGQLDSVRRTLEATFTGYGYRRVDVPVLEPAELHLRKSGLEIISKLYAFDDQGGRRLCLRPELTASVVRALVAQPPPRLPLKVFAGGPVFRYERPAKGRYRQFTQCGVELVGAPGPLADAEVVALAMDALDRFGLREYRVTVGHVGILADLLAKLGLDGRLRTQLMESVEVARRHGLGAVQAQLREIDPDLFDPRPPVAAGAPRSSSPASRATRLPAAADLDGAGDDGPAGRADGAERSSLAGMLAQLGAEHLGRRSKEEVVERLLRKMRPETQREAVTRALTFIERLGRIGGAPREALAAGSDLLKEYGLGDEPLLDLQQTVGYLADFGVDLDRVALDLGLSRGLQYYTGMVFEIDHSELGAESQLCGGGRYDDLCRALGYRQAVPALGFAFGVERVSLALAAEGRPPDPAPVADVFVVASSAAQGGYAGRVARALRRRGQSVDLDVAGRSLRASLAYADRAGYALVALVGPEEMGAGSVRLRDMTAGQERTVALSDLDRDADV
jgi:histidyl-tRNA synthetase